MKEIKTVVTPIGEAYKFDIKVNRLLSDNWVLKKRDIVSAQGEPNEAFNFPAIRLLYAELERSTVQFEEVTA